MKHVLVVEDDPHNAVVFRKLLEKRAGCRVTVTEAAEDLMRFAAAGGVDLIIMDVSLATRFWSTRWKNGSSSTTRILISAGCFMPPPRAVPGSG